MYHKIQGGKVLVAVAILVAAGCHGGAGTIPAAPLSVPGAIDAMPDAKDPLKLSASSLAFTNVGATNTKKIFATEKSYTGKFKVVSTCGKSVTIAPATAKGPHATFKVTPNAAIASCTLTVSDSKKHKASAKISIKVPAPPALNVNPASLSFDATGTSYQSTFAVTQTGTGAFHESDSCSGIATVSTGTTFGAPSASATVTPVSAGTCSITIGDSYSQQKQIPVTVTTSGIVIQ